MQDMKDVLPSKPATDPQQGFATSLLVRFRCLLRNGIGSFGRAAIERRMELLETLPLGGKRQLMLVLCDGQRYLVGAGSDEVHAIVEMRPRQQTDKCSSATGDRACELQPGFVLQSYKPEMRRSQ